METDTREKILGRLMPKELSPIDSNEFQHRRNLHHMVVYSLKMRRRAAPGVGKRVLHKTGCYRIELHVPDRSMEMSLIEQAGMKSILPQKAFPAFPEIHHSGVSPVRFADSPCQRVFLGRNCDQMNVIGHKAVCPYFHSGFLAPFGENGKIRSIVI